MIAEKCGCLPSEIASRLTWDEFLLMGEFYEFRAEEEKKAMKAAQPPPKARTSRRKTAA